MTFGSLFAGIGGFDLGFERAGMGCRWQCEIDPFCQKVLEKHWPDVKRYGDIKEVDWNEVERVDVVCGGFPCQPVSVAGKRLAQDDERWLWPEFARCVGALRPRFAVMENVPGLLTAGMGDVLGDLWSLGYDAEWQVISAAAMGAPHLRERVWIVAYPSQLLGNGGNDYSRGYRIFGQQVPEFGNGSSTESIPDAEGSGFPPRDDGSRKRELGRGDCGLGGWAPEPNVGRVAYGIPDRVDRLKSLGNAVVPQIPEFIGRRLMETLEAM